MKLLIGAGGLVAGVALFVWMGQPQHGADSPEMLLELAQEAERSADGAQVLALIVPEGRVAFVSRFAARMDGYPGFDLGRTSMHHGLGNLSNRTMKDRFREVEISVEKDTMELADFTSVLLEARQDAAAPLFGPLAGPVEADFDSASGTVRLGDREVEARFSIRDERYFIAPLRAFP